MIERFEGRGKLWFAHTSLQKVPDRQRQSGVIDRGGGILFPSCIDSVRCLSQCSVSNYACKCEDASWFSVFHNNLVARQQRRRHLGGRGPIDEDHDQDHPASTASDVSTHPVNLVDTVCSSFLSGQDLQD